MKAQNSKSLQRNLISMTLSAASVLTGLLASSCGSGDNLSLPELEFAEGAKAPSETNDAARNIFNQRFAKYGDSHYSVRVVCKHDTSMAAMRAIGQQVLNGEVPVLDTAQFPLHIIRMELIQFRGLKTTVSEDDLSEADKLNGITWRGKYVVNTKVERRRNLDLFESVKMLDKAEDIARIPWTKRELTLGVSGKSWIQFVREQDSKKAPNEQEMMVPNIFGALGGQILSDLVDSYTGSEWGDWWEPQGNAYQHCDITLRDKEVICETWEDIDNVLLGESLVTTPNPEAMFEMMGLGGIALAEGEEVTFLLKPNLKVLEEAGLIEK